MHALKKTSLWSNSECTLLRIHLEFNCSAIIHARNSKTELKGDFGSGGGGGGGGGGGVRGILSTVEK